MQRLLEVTNATKAAVGLLVNAIFGVLTVFDVGLTDAQTGAVLVLLNAVGVLFLALTYQLSAKRIPDA